MKTRSNVRKYHNESAWRQLIDEWLTSGLGQREFCIQHGVGYSTFGKWKKRILSEPASPDRDFVEMAMPVESASTWDVEVELGKGLILRLRRR